MAFDEKYFSTHTYQNISFSRFSQYWWSNRFFAILARRYGRTEANLLEIGSGLGHLAGQLEKSFRTVAVDVNQWALQKSKEAVRQTFLVTSTAEELPFPDKAFEIVIIKHVVEHLQHPDRSIAEIGRVTAPGGVLILATPNPTSLLKPLKGKNWIGYQDPTHISLKSPTEWLDLVRINNFSPTRFFSDGFWDVPYIPFVPRIIQKFIFGSLGGIQAILGYPFLPIRWGESIIIIAKKV